MCVAREGDRTWRLVSSVEDYGIVTEQCSAGQEGAWPCAAVKGGAHSSVFGWLC